jgi:hypothetical protein
VFLAVSLKLRLAAALLIGSALFTEVAGHHMPALLIDCTALPYPFSGCAAKPHAAAPPTKEAAAAACSGGGGAPLLGSPQLLQRINALR